MSCCKVKSKLDCHGQPFMSSLRRWSNEDSVGRSEHHNLKVAVMNAVAKISHHNPNP